ncbi:S-layer homology domain-containing protein [Propionispora vibrioides]|uniref:S-layer homology domain-containing protein n=1 Tax=Propionispora vibrioides TaxID=112903 RepID=A0A1H8XPQ6_9FIRM|nr:S-layer homology domain-containing protein [Propionispora vibrioides]SEP41702.1 S-layer homology domain-containing protein [Propionispora vibrioides]
MAGIVGRITPEYAKCIVFVIFMINIASFCFASVDEFSNPFNDVPKNHWAYDSINKLMKDGIVDGENGKFNGDKTITRYEMAQIVAKAMTKYDKADSEAKAEINRLEIEFAGELKDLGVRLSAVENQVSNAVQIHGVIKNYYDDVRGNSGPTQTNLKQDARMYFSGKIDDNWSWEEDIVYTPNRSLPGPFLDFRSNSNSGTPAGISSNGCNITGNHLFGNDSKVVLGYQWVGPINDNWVYSIGMKGVRVDSKIGAVNVTGAVGQFDVLLGSGDSRYTTSDKNLGQVYAVNGNIGNTSLGAAYWKVNDQTNQIDWKITEWQIKQPLSNNVLLDVNAGKSNAASEEKFYVAKLSYGNVNPYVAGKKGSLGFYVDYHSIGINSILGPDESSASALYTDAVSGSSGSGLKGFRLGCEYVPLKNVSLTSYVMPKNTSISNSDLKTTVFRTMLFILY